ncbi:hypothetical protein [Streptomyces sp. KM273126]|uniref:hypothetical protein n=1 Tax=Streptomyces sp. KM273126 TaxID=2545247 RepID=UPI00215D8067|nr:hypothetical protein [Streptomyces sp. KM273126]
MDGVLRIDTYGGADLPPSSNRFSPCRCPQHCPTPSQDGAARLSAAVREVNERGRGERLRRLAAVVGCYAGPLLIITISGSVGFVLGVAAASTPT